MNEIIYQHHHCAHGELVLGSFNEQLCLCDWRYRKMGPAIGNRLRSQLKAEFVEGESDVIQHAIDQLSEYFSYQRKVFDVPLLPVGSPFQHSVWRALLEIPFGSTSTYRQLAEAIGKPSAIRAVASANGANALAILVPCHRIIGSDGSLVGYAGGLRVKEKLLDLERDLLVQ